MLCSFHPSRWVIFTSILLVLNSTLFFTSCCFYPAFSCFDSVFCWFYWNILSSPNILLFLTKYFVVTREYLVFYPEFYCFNPTFCYFSPTCICFFMQHFIVFFTKHFVGFMQHLVVFTKHYIVFTQCFIVFMLILLDYIKQPSIF